MPNPSIQWADKDNHEAHFGLCRGGFQWNLNLIPTATVNVGLAPDELTYYPEVVYWLPEFFPLIGFIWFQHSYTSENTRDSDNSATVTQTIELLDKDQNVLKWAINTTVARNHIFISNNYEDPILEGGYLTGSFDGGTVDLTNFSLASYDQTIDDEHASQWGYDELPSIAFFNAIRFTKEISSPHAELIMCSANLNYTLNDITPFIGSK